MICYLLHSLWAKDHTFSGAARHFLLIRLISIANDFLVQCCYFNLHIRPRVLCVAARLIDGETAAGEQQVSTVCCYCDRNKVFVDQTAGRLTAVHPGTPLAPPLTGSRVSVQVVRCELASASAVRRSAEQKPALLLNEASFCFSCFL